VNLDLSKSSLLRDKIQRDTVAEKSSLNLHSSEHVIRCSFH
jgi:hypothetical protein